ncbi:hypothetical protein GA0070616_0186 [Micromonospora nigra]|uniref:Uncharacterized protein n=1 Tax=Micromonospora nigra TaxID=145857 RepID=A0A1C6R912_9ACTN|nr:hypothetical protein [Micromonospora nigra]SCL13585.1 hypothetical protein GA0070616_0186 [Micromonospora nigra]
MNRMERVWRRLVAPTSAGWPLALLRMAATALATVVAGGAAAVAIAAPASAATTTRICKSSPVPAG